MSRAVWTDGWVQGIRERAAQAVLACAQDLAEKSAAQAPLDTGALRASVRIAAEGTRAAVSFNTPYAVAQHERLYYHHAVGKAKYLEDPLNENRERYIGAIAQAVGGKRP